MRFDGGALFSISFFRLQFCRYAFDGSFLPFISSSLYFHPIWFFIHYKLIKRIRHKNRQNFNTISSRYPFSLEIVLGFSFSEFISIFFAMDSIDINQMYWTACLSCCCCCCCWRCCELYVFFLWFLLQFQFTKRFNVWMPC